METDHDGTTVHETGWMLARGFQGRGLASAALTLLLERARAEPTLRAIARLAGRDERRVERAVSQVRLRLLGEEDGSYRDATLRVNHWVLTLR
jgi:hypothetical protein